MKKREKPRSVRFSRDEEEVLQEHLSEMQSRGIKTNPNRFIRESVMKNIRRRMT